VLIDADLVALPLVGLSKLKKQRCVEYCYGTYYNLPGTRVFHSSLCTCPVRSRWDSSRRNDERPERTFRWRKSKTFKVVIQVSMSH
jgi:hypothetical protein